MSMAGRFKKKKRGLQYEKGCNCEGYINRTECPEVVRGQHSGFLGLQEGNETNFTKPKVGLHNTTKKRGIQILCTKCTQCIIVSSGQQNRNRPIKTLH